MERHAALPPFERLLTEHGEVVLRVCRALLPPADADDAWSETFLASLRAYPSLTDASNLRGWLVTIAHRKALDQLRSTARRATPMADLPQTPLTEDRLPALDGEELRALLERLPHKQRLAVTYRYLGDLAYPDVAALLDCSPAAARRNVADGLAALRRLTAPDDPIRSPT